MDNNQPFSKKAAEKKLTRKQKALADYLLAHPKSSAKEAAQHAYNLSTGRTAEVIGSRELRKVEVQAYMQSHAKVAQDTLLEVMKVSRDYAKGGGKEGASYASVALTGAKDVMDRVYGKATQNINTNSTSVNLNIDLSN